MVCPLIGIQSREVGRRSGARHIGITAAIHRDGVSQIVASRAEVGAVDQRAGGRKLRHEGVRTAIIGWIVSTRGCREVGRGSPARDIGIAAAIDRDVISLIVVYPAEVGAVNQPD